MSLKQLLVACRLLEPSAVADTCVSAVAGGAAEGHHIGFFTVRNFENQNDIFQICSRGTS